MAFNARCSTCGAVGLTVRAGYTRHADVKLRRCLDCCRSLEFSDGRSWRGFVTWRVRRDDVQDDREQVGPLHAAAVLSKTEFFPALVLES